jgi:predicted enzyme related to lactoylglutathione lyase
MAMRAPQGGRGQQQEWCGGERRGAGEGWGQHLQEFPLYSATMAENPLFLKIDCLRLPVPDLDAALEFYRDRLGHALIWRSETSAAVRLPDSNAELVLQTERPEMETDLMVESVEAAVGRFVAAGGRLLQGPFHVQIGRCAVVADPFRNVLVMLDASKGRLRTNAEGHVVGNEPPH